MIEFVRHGSTDGTFVPGRIDNLTVGIPLSLFKTAYSQYNANMEFCAGKIHYLVPPFSKF